MIYIMGMIITVYFLLVTASTEDEKNKSEIILNSLPVGRSQLVMAKYLSVFAYILIGAVFLGLVGLLFKLSAFSFTVRLINAGDLLGAGLLVSAFPYTFPCTFSSGQLPCAFSEEELGFPPVPIPESRTRINAAEKQSYYYDYVKNIGLSVPLILVGGHRNIERMENLLKEGKVDFLSLCRPLICEPEFPNRWLEGFGSENAAGLFKRELSQPEERDGTWVGLTGTDSRFPPGASSQPGLISVLLKKTTCLKT